MHIDTVDLMSTIAVEHRVDFLIDLRSAAVLSGLTGVFAAFTVPMLLPSVFEQLPPDQRTLPMPLPVFCIALAFQLFVIYGLLGLAGLRLARARHREPAPALTTFWARQPSPGIAVSAGRAFGTGLVCGCLLVGVMYAIRQILPETLPATLHPPSLLGALLASATASFGEEILFRLFLLSALLRVLPVSTQSTVLAIVISSLLFGVFHAPAAVALFGGLARVPLLFWVWMILLNAFVGTTCAVWFLRSGIGAAILVHAGTDLVWHVLSQLQG